MPNPLLSVVTGTYNRFAYLQRMVQSVREQLPRHIAYEVVIVDGGSMDGTLEWASDQRDVKLIQHGALLGAIKAFCDGARAASGDYVIMANDDVTFHPNSILRALAYLEEHRTCGAVAFADDRHSQAMQQPTEHRVMHMPALGVDGQPTGVVYAQVGMFRRWLGDLVGWWGDQDAIMGRARVYGGDNYLSSRIWELGYSVDAVEGCEIDDLIPRDALRQLNTERGSQDSAQYYARYPRGAQLQPYAQVPNPQHERLRIVLMDIHEARLPASKAQEQGLAEALAAVGLLWHVDYINEEWDLPAIVQAWQPHLLLTQIHDTERINGETLRAARAEKPDMVIVNWNGDAHERGLTAPNIIETLKQVDLQTVVNAKVLPVYQQEGIHAAYWQIAYKDPAQPFEGDVPEWDILFLGNAYNEERRALVAALQETGLKVGLYGNVEGSSGNTHYDFALSRALYEHCLIAISDTFPGTEAFVSNRLFQALSAGAFVLQQRSAKLDQYTGLRAGEHYIEWRDLRDLKKKIALWSADEKAAERERIAEAGKSFVRANFSYPAQVSKLWDLLEAVA